MALLPHPRQRVSQSRCRCTQGSPYALPKLWVGKCKLPSPALLPVHLPCEQKRSSLSAAPGYCVGLITPASLAGGCIAN
jgi:hypothetical protein